ncbi:MAG: NAD(P)H-binding protein [Gammaproteobacteria bacterium]
MFKTLLRNIFKDHHLQESYITASDLDWTIVRPAILSDKQEIGHHMGSQLRSNSVSRLDVASSLCNQISDKTYIKKAVLVS